MARTVTPETVPHYVAVGMLLAGMILGGFIVAAAHVIERQERTRQERQRSAELGPCSRRFYDWERDGI
jgi:hypothetical protein